MTEKPRGYESPREPFGLPVMPPLPTSQEPDDGGAWWCGLIGGHAEHVFMTSVGKRTCWGGGHAPQPVFATEKQRPGFPVTQELRDEVPDMVNHPPHYTSHPSGVECIEIVRHMGFNLGNAFKYIWRADLKGEAIEDLRKALFYINDEITKRENEDKRARGETP